DAGNVCSGSPIDARKERDDVGCEAVLIGLYPVGQIEHCILPTRPSQILAAPGDAARVRNKKSGYEFQQRGLASTVRTDDSEHLARVDRECNAGDGLFLDVTLCEIRDSEKLQPGPVRIRGRHRSPPSAD